VSRAIAGVSAGALPAIPHFHKLLYTAATTVVFHAAVLEPHNMRTSYWHFLMRLTGGRFADFNRTLVAELGTDPTRLFPDYPWPKYDPTITALAAGPLAAGGGGGVPA
jgi:hypothetical protein